MKKYSFGIDVNSLEKFMTTPRSQKKAWGWYTRIVDIPEYRLEHATLSKGKSFSFSTPRGFETTVYIEEGEIKIKNAMLGARNTMCLRPRSKVSLEALVDSTVYFFSGPSDAKSKHSKVATTSDHRDKYWGEIETIVSKSGYSGKRMVVQKGTSASLEFHCQKLESYYIHEGKLLLRLKAGRGEDRFFEMQKGEVSVTPPGLMHQRGGLEDTVIIEIATRDSDSDSFLVEDGAKMPMPRLAELVSEKSRDTRKGKKICFDIDGVLCTQTEGGYEKAKPHQEAIALVNKLYGEGHTIYIFTARLMGRNKNDWRKAYEDGYDFTKKQLDLWGVKYHGLFFGKPNLDIMIDDRALFFEPDMKIIEREIRKKII